eukprot:2844144-Amphidinium_carterae.1
MPALKAPHCIPEAGTIWEDFDGVPCRREVPRTDPRFLAVVGAERPCVRGRVSVVVATTSERHEFHAQLWLCFVVQ